MKKTALIFGLLLAASVCAMAQGVHNTVSVTDIEFRRTEEHIEATFNIHIGKKATKSDYSLVITPVLSKGGDRMEMQPIVVQGRKAATAAGRHTMVSGREFFIGQAIYARNGETVGYRASFEYQPWMSGSSLELEGVSIGCCSATATQIGLIAENMLIEPPRRQIVINETEQVIVERQVSTGDRLATNFPFIAPIDDYETARGKAESGDLFDHKNPDFINQRDIDRYIDDNRKTSLTIYFKQGSSTLESDFRSNYRSLTDLVTAVRMIENSGDSKIVRVVIAGFASPEGTLSLNDRLAWDRAVTVKNFLMNNSSLGQVDVNIHNGSVDWRGLRQMVAGSDMYDKHRIIDIIDNYSVGSETGQDGRLNRLKSLNGGVPYRYMYDNFFPELRNATYIKVYYENTEP